MKMEQAECSETSACKIQTPGNYPEENIQQIIYYIAVWRQNTLGNIPELYCCMGAEHIRGHT